MQPPPEHGRWNETPGRLISRSALREMREIWRQVTLGYRLEADDRRPVRPAQNEPELDEPLFGAVTTFSYMPARIEGCERPLLSEGELRRLLDVVERQRATIVDLEAQLSHSKAVLLEAQALLAERNFGGEQSRNEDPLAEPNVIGFKSRGRQLVPGPRRMRPKAGAEVERFLESAAASVAPCAVQLLPAGAEN